MLARRSLILFIMCLLLASCAAHAADLAQGGVRKGDVDVMTHNAMDMVALDDMISALGFASTPASGGLVITFNGKKLEFWDGSSASRVNGIVYPLMAPVFRKNGHWWGEASTSVGAMSSFLSSIGRPSDLKITAGTAPKTSQPAQASEPSRPNPKVETPPAPIETKPQPAPTNEIAMISKVRWGEQPDCVRAVVDISRPVETKITHKHEMIDVAFPETMSSTIRSASTRNDLFAESKQSSSTVVVTFHHKAKSVKGYWLTDPPRYVLDFYYDKPAEEPVVAEKPKALTPAPVQTKPAPAQTKPTPSQTKPTPTAPQKPQTSARKRPLVVVDAGHGGHDPGAIGNKLQEKSINLSAAIELEKSLKALGIDVLLTRRDDRYLKLAERTEIANTHNADIFISLHCNALPKGKHAKGTELYLMAESTDRDAMNLAVIENRELSGNAQSAEEINAAADKRTKLLLTILGDMQQNDKITESTSMAEDLYSRLKSAGISIRNVRQAPFFVLRGAGMPAVLVEMGYITEASDAKNLASPAHRKKMMDAAARGIQQYLKKTGAN